MAHVTSFRVRFYELDPYGHLNHSVYVQYFEVARIEVLEDLGIGLHELAARGIHLVVADIATTFRRPVGPGMVEVHSELLELGRVQSRWYQEVRQGGEVAAFQHLRAAATTPEGRPTRVPTEIVDRLTTVLRP